LGGTLGRTGLAQFLTGSRASWLEAFSQHSHYGRLGDLSQKAVLNIIDALIADGKLLTTGGSRPKVILPEQNLQPPQPLREMDSPPPSTSDVPASAAAPPPDPPSLQPDPTLLETLRDWRGHQAKAQSVPPYIVFPNKVLEAIAAQQPTTLEELERIPGIGPAKLEQYGSAILTIVTGGSQDQIDVEKSTSLTIAETAEPSPVTAQAIGPMEIIITVVTDLDGLLTIEGLSRLLTAAPDEIVSFSDHPRFAACHGTLTAEEMQSHIQQVIGSGEVVLNRHQRLVLPE